MVALCEREGISVKSYLLAETVHLEVSFFFRFFAGWIESDNGSEYLLIRNIFLLMRAGLRFMCVLCW